MPKRNLHLLFLNCLVIRLHGNFACCESGWSVTQLARGICVAGSSPAAPISTICGFVLVATKNAAILVYLRGLKSSHQDAQDIAVKNMTGIICPPYFFVPVALLFAL